MFVLNDDMSIYATRGDTVFFTVSATDGTGANYKFKPDDVVRFKAFEKKNCDNVVSQKDFVVTEETDKVSIYLSEDETRFGKIINKPRDYWYEIELNPYTNPQTIIGYDDEGPKVFRLYPESKDLVEEIPEEDLETVDDELSPISTRPIQNQVVTRAMTNLSTRLEYELKKVTDSVLTEEVVTAETSKLRGELNAFSEEVDAELDALSADIAKQKSDLTKYLPKDGSVPMSGELLLNGGYGRLHALGEFAYLYAHGTGNTSGDGRALMVLNEKTTINDSIRLRNKSGGSTKDYKLYGEHNKPSGSYTGNGSATKREIQTGGIGSLLHVWSPYYGRHSLVGEAGAVTWISSGSVANVKSEVIKWKNGVLTMNTTDLAFNGSVDYLWEVL